MHCHREVQKAFPEPDYHNSKQKFNTYEKILFATMKKKRYKGEYAKTA